MSDYISKFYNNFNDVHIEDLLNQHDQNMVKEILKFAKYISDNDIQLDSTLNELEKDIQGLVDLIGKLRSLSPNERDRIVHNYRPNFQKIRVSFYELIKHDDINGLGEFIDNREKYYRDVEAVQDTRVNVEQVISDHQKKFNDFMNLAKERLANIGILDYEQVFGKESEQFEKIATRWFWGLLISLIALMAAAIFIPGVSQETTAGGIAEAIFRKVVAISGLFYVVSLCARNYRASKHNALVNKHRQNALKTFQIFVKSVQDDDAQTKNAVLLKATETIFGNQPSGFLPDSGDADMSPKIIEIFKNIPTVAGK